MNSTPLASSYPATSNLPSNDNTRTSAAVDYDSRQSYPLWQNHNSTTANYRSVTPAMNNLRRGVGASPNPATRQAGMHYGGTPQNNGGRFVDSFTSPDQASAQTPSGMGNGNTTPSSTGLIRLTLRKPMGIVFEPMYDPNAPSVQRGVRICDLPRTGAAALSRKLEVGDELLSINDKTMSRLTFDEIMDFIIEADPEEVNLLFRRPRKEILNARHGIKQPSNPNGPGVKWIDDDERNTNKTSVASSTINTKSTDKPEPGSTPAKKKDKKSRRSRNKDDDETLQSEDQQEFGGRAAATGGRNAARRKGRRRKDPYESESFLDILIDTICANPDSVCRDRRGRADHEEYYSDDDETFASRDDSTYVTYESEDRSKIKKKLKEKVKGQNRDDDSTDYDETEDDTFDEKRNAKAKRDKDGNRLIAVPESSKPDPSSGKNTGKYEDDGTLETVDSIERAKAMEAVIAEQTPPLGLAPNPEPALGATVGPSDTDDDGNPAPIKEVEYDDMDNGADVSVMESLGGPSLLIEKQRQAQAVAVTKVPVPPVPAEIMDNFGKDYPLDFGFSREQTIQNDPLRFYTFVVKGLLQEHEPEKVRLLDKLLAKYRGREDHLVQKLSVRYNKEDEGGQDNGLGAARSFEDAVKEGKSSSHAREAIQAARERMQKDDFHPEQQWPEKETKEPDEGDEGQQLGEAESESASEYSGDSIDGTSPAVIAQVSELLNYVYGKTSVPGQIDRVSTIMRAYEGREAVLLELLETKALIKANREKENAGQLPSFLRNSANAQRTVGSEMHMNAGDVPPVTPMAQAAIHDDISSMSGVSSPAEGQQQAVNAGVLKQISVSRLRRISSSGDYKSCTTTHLTKFSFSINRHTKLLPIHHHIVAELVWTAPRLVTKLNFLQQHPQLPLL
jgi:PDZ domain